MSIPLLLKLVTDKQEITVCRGYLEHEKDKFDCQAYGFNSYSMKEDGSTICSPKKRLKKHYGPNNCHKELNAKTN